MIKGIGNDIIEVKRIKSIIDRYQNRFLKRIFTPYEQNYCLAKKEPSLHFAGRFAAKEAIVKALGTGLRDGLTWLDIEIRNDVKGKPFIVLSDKLLNLFQGLSISVSISHCHEYATAVAICEI